MSFHPNMARVVTVPMNAAAAMQMLQMQRALQAARQGAASSTVLRASAPAFQPKQSQPQPRPLTAAGSAASAAAAAPMPHPQQPYYAQPFQSHTAVAVPLPAPFSMMSPRTLTASQSRFQPVLINGQPVYAYAAPAGAGYDQKHSMPHQYGYHPQMHAAAAPQPRMVGAPSAEDRKAFYQRVHTAYNYVPTPKGSPQIVMSPVTKKNMGWSPSPIAGARAAPSPSFLAGTINVADILRPPTPYALPGSSDGTAPAATAAAPQNI